MYVKDKNNRITLRLNDSQFSFVKSMSDVLGVSPSDFLRMVINTAMASNKMATNVVTTIASLGGLMDVRTTKPISTISFNTPDYLAVKLSELTQAKILSFWAFIPHLPEDDEGGKKEHIHVYIEPSKMVQTDDIRHELRQPDPNQPNMLLGCLPFKSSNFGNWYLYGLHDPLIWQVKDKVASTTINTNKLLLMTPIILLLTPVRLICYQFPHIKH